MPRAGLELDSTVSDPASVLHMTPPSTTISGGLVDRSHISDAFGAPVMNVPVSAYTDNFISYASLSLMSHVLVAAPTSLVEVGTSDADNSPMAATIPHQGSVASSDMAQPTPLTPAPEPISGAQGPGSKKTSLGAAKKPGKMRPGHANTARYVVTSR
jgi:hypothetical protein